MSTIVPSFNSLVPTTFFSFTTLTLFLFSHWTTIKHICRNAILSKTVEERNNLTHKWSTDEKYNQRCLYGYAWSEVFLSLERGVDNKDTRLSFYTTSEIFIPDLQSIKQFCWQLTQRRTTSKLWSCYYSSVTCTFHLYVKKDLCV